MATTAMSTRALNSYPGPLRSQGARKKAAREQRKLVEALRRLNFLNPALTRDQFLVGLFVLSRGDCVLRFMVSP